MVWSSKLLGNTNYKQLQHELRGEYAEESPSGNAPKKRAQKVVDPDGRLILPEAYRKRWGLTPGTEFLVQETPEGLFLRPLDPPLKKVYVEPTSRCNLNCQTCVRRSWNEPTGFMDMRHFNRLMNDLRSVPSLEKIAFWGIGEPLLHRDIVEMVSSAHALGVETELITNALLLDQTAAEDGRTARIRKGRSQTASKRRHREPRSP